MNKLVSKNPVQRFKESKKIIKGENGIGRWFYNGKEVFSDDGGRTFKLNNSGTLVGSPNAIKNLVKADKVGRTGYKVGNTWYQIGTGKKATSFTSSTQPKTNNFSKICQSENDYADKLLKSNTAKVSTPVDNYYLKGFENRKDEIAKLGGVRAVQKMLGFTAGNGLDGKWGKNTEDAYQKYLIANAAKTPSLEDTISTAQNQPILSTPTINPSEYTFTESQLSGLGENPYYEPHPELRFNNFDRTQTRQWLRDNGFNPYSLTGAQRKALRMILNGQGTDEDKNLIGLTNGLSEILTNYKYLKQGGNILPSRNIVKRFKLKKGNKLPNAPKAEDRFKNGVKDSVAYLGVPGKDNSYFGETIKRVTTPDNAAIQRQILFRHYPHDNDTIYTEVPEHTKRFSIFPQVNIIPRKGFSFAQTPEYEILKRRFNTAWNLAK